MDEEWQIIEKVLSGDVTAFEEIVRLHKSHVFKIVANMVAQQDVEEVAQTAFIRVYRDLPSYCRRAPFQHWLSKVTVRACYDYWRQQRRQKVFAVSDDDFRVLETTVAGLAESEGAAVRRAKDLLDNALGHLAPEDRLVFSLLYLEEMPMKEVGKTMGWSLAKIKIRSFRARHALKKILRTSNKE